MNSLASQKPGRSLGYPRYPNTSPLLSYHAQAPEATGFRLSVGSRKNLQRIHKESSSRFWKSVCGVSEGFPTAGLPRSCTLCSQKSGQWGGKQNTAEFRLQRVCAGTCEMHQEGPNMGLGILSCCCGNHINSNKCVVSWVRESGCL